jgi:excisionase family DNA binding protein
MPRASSPKPQFDEELLTVAEVARRLRVDSTTVRRWISQGALEAVTLPHVGKRQSYRVRLSTLDNLLKTPVNSAQ